MPDESLSMGRAPPAPNPAPTWASARKDGVGTALGNSRLWFTIAGGIVTEIYYPRADVPQLKDLGFIVADGQGFWVELRRMASYTIDWVAGAVPAFVVKHRHARFEVTLKICVDPERDVLLVDYLLSGDDELSLYVLAAPRLGGDATRNEAAQTQWVGRPLLWASQGPFGLAVAAVGRSGAPAFLRRSVGCVGESDLWQDFDRNGAMTWDYAQAGPGEIALAAQLVPSGTLALGCSSSRESAATLALQSLAMGFAASWRAYCREWQHWLSTVRPPATLRALLTANEYVLLRRSAAVIKCHEDRSYPGALVASLSVPWGESSDSRGGYHLVWARDLVETGGALLALGCRHDARRILGYLIATQQADGHWFQNQWLGGKAFWQGVQLDEAAFPVLLASALAADDGLGHIDVHDMVRRALQFIVRFGPASAQDRWEEEAGINTFTLSLVIAALVEGSRFLEPRGGECALMLADTWNSQIEEATWASGTRLAAELGVSGYYMRSAPADVLVDAGAKHRAIRVQNHSPTLDLAADEQVAIDCLQLVRFGLRRADEPSMRDSVTAIDATLKVQTPSGPVWRRYAGDGYGEKADGAPFDGSGQGRGWPLLTGERGHYALCAGKDARTYLTAMANMVGPGGLLPEQVWDSAPIVERDLYPGKPSGGAMPLVWAHAEFIKLALSIGRGSPVDRPARTWARYRGIKPALDYALWQPEHRIAAFECGKEVRLLLPEPSRVHWWLGSSPDTVTTLTDDVVLGHLTQADTRSLKAGETVRFTIEPVDEPSACTSHELQVHQALATHA